MSDSSAGEKNQLETTGKIEPLGVDQEKALELLLSGRSMGDTALAAGDAKSALQLLKGMGIIRDEPAGLTDPADVKMAAELEVKKRKSGLACQKRMLEYDDRMWRMGMR
jgi:hypothetical protein